MSSAGVVDCPQMWPFCGYNEIQQPRRRSGRGCRGSVIKVSQKMIHPVSVDLQDHIAIQVVAPPSVFFNVHLSVLSSAGKEQPEYWSNDKSQNSSTKLQINLKIQYLMTKTSLEFGILI